MVLLVESDTLQVSSEHAALPNLQPSTFNL